MVSPMNETPRALSRTSYARCAEWDSVCGTHQGQKSDAPRKQAGHKTASDHTPLTKNVLLCRSHPHRTEADRAVLLGRSRSVRKAVPKSGELKSGNAHPRQRFVKFMTR